VNEPSFDLAVNSKRILCLDIENAPRWYGPGDYTYPIVFVVGYKWVGEPDESVVSVLIDPRSDQETKQQLTAPLWAALAEADSFLGHNFRHDWGGVSGLARDVGASFPERRTTIDTMRSIPRHQGASKSLENLCKELGVGEDIGGKPHLTAYDWTAAYHYWLPEFIQRVRHRNRIDVILTERLYLKEKELGWL
jgi:hypothetical protein